MSQKREQYGHCSVLIKLLEDKSDLYSTHTTWSYIGTMTRIYKHYDFPLTFGNGSNEIIPGKRVIFSSYPGVLSSIDDWYTTSPAGLVVTETTIDNNNKSLYDLVKPQTLFYWIRNIVANRLSNSAPEWMETFEKYNSGTYNNEWMVVDYKLFTPGQSLQPGTVCVMDQMPGPYIVWEDISDRINTNGYFSSYNVPFFPEIFNISGQNALVRKYGESYSWSEASRARIFARLQNNVTDESSLMKVIRHNEYQTDPEGMEGCENAPGSASNALSERGDLTTDQAGCIAAVGPHPGAGIDAKYVTSSLMAQLKAFEKQSGEEWIVTVRAQSGPTYDSQPPFDWTTSVYSDMSHIGQPDLWKFPWIDVAWPISSSSVFTQTT